MSMSNVRLILKSLVNDNIAGFRPAAMAMSTLPSDSRQDRGPGHVTRETRDGRFDPLVRCHLNLARRSVHREKLFSNTVTTIANLKPMMENGSLSLQAGTVKEPDNPGGTRQQSTIKDSQKMNMLAGPVEAVVKHEDMDSQETAGSALDQEGGRDVKEEVRKPQFPLTGRSWTSVLPGILSSLKGLRMTGLTHGGHEKVDNKEDVSSGRAPDCDLSRLELGPVASGV